MKHSDITFQNMTQKLLEAVPELKSFHDRALAAEGGEWTGKHIAYHEVVSKAVKEALRSEVVDDCLLHKIFDFVEMLATHPAEHVQEVVHDSVCEPICSDELVRQRAGKYIGPATKNFCKGIITWEPPAGAA